MNKKVMFYCFIVLLFLLVANIIKLPLPEGVLEWNFVSGKIDHCNIKNTTGGNRYEKGKSNFVGIKLKGHDQYFRWNPNGKEFDEILLACKKGLNIEFKYKAKRTLLSPNLSFWVEEVK